MILHICGNLAAGKTTTAEALHPQLRWPVVPIGRIRNVCQDEWLAWRVVECLWRTWDSPDLTPGRSGIWVSTGLNVREHIVLYQPRYLRRVWLTADPAVLRERMAQRHRPNNTGYWPYPESWDTLQDDLIGYNTGARPLPWPVNRTFDTGTMPTATIVRAITSLIREPWPTVPPTVSETASVWHRLNADLPIYEEIRAARNGSQSSPLRKGRGT